MQNDYIKYAGTAHRILNEKTRYNSNKQIISSLFDKELDDNNPEHVKYRLTIIDSYYSTQMNKRLYGIEQIAETLSLVSDRKIKKEIILFLKGPIDNTWLFEILNKSYGINKEGKCFGKATSLISKYLYFLNDYNFPIYDSLVLTSYPILTRKKIKKDNYFNSLKVFNEESNINNYEKLDNLLWLLGKLKKGSFSILMDIEKYQRITSIKDVQSQFIKINDGKAKNKSTLKDDVIRDYIAENYKKSDMFIKEEKVFFDFVFNISN